jgi:hypothetical protein
MNYATKALPALLALACAGCISVLPEPKDAAPRYDVALPEVPAAAPEAAPARILVVGKVRAAEEASGRAIRTADLETGRTGRLSDGELALTPEAIVGAFLRARLSAAHPGAIVCDASVAPHAGARTTFGTWIERFRLEKREDGWFFTVRLRVLAEAPDGSVAVANAAQSVPVAAEGSRPTAAETVRAISKAIDACATMAEVTSTSKGTTP